MRRRRLLKYLPVLLLLVGSVVHSAPSVEPINLSADSLVLNQESGLYRAEGDVRISQGKLSLTAETADWNQESGQADCSGGIRLESPDGILTGESMTYDFTTGLGLLQNGDARLTRHSVYLSGEQIEKRGDISYRVTGGTFTTCEGDDPAWKLTASRLDVDVEGYARARNAIFYLREVPILYLPYIALPAKTVRQSGLLFPEISHSTRFGNQYVQPYYLVIDDHADATLTLDYMADFGLGSGLEFRYLLQESRPGKLYGNYVTGFDDEPDRALIEWAHDGMLPGQVRLVADVEYASKKDYYSIFGRDADVFTREKEQSILYLSRAWDKTVLAGQAKYNRDLKQSSATQLQYLPEVRFNYLPQRVGTSPFFFSFLGEPTYLWHRDGLKGGRLRLLPTVSSDLLVSRYLEFVPAISWLQRNYRVTGQDEEEGLPVLTATAGTRLSRVYNVGGKKLTHIRHAVEPMLHYRYIPDVDQSHLPQFDSYDQVDPVNLLTFELMNRLTARWQKGGDIPRYREVASLRLSIDYDIREERRTAGPLPDKNRPFSPIRGELILRPTENSFLRGDAAYNANDNSEYVENWAAWGGFHDRHGNGLMVNYTYLRNDFDYISGGVDLAFLDPLHASYEQRYDLETDTKLEEEIQLEYRGQCWSFLVSYNDRPEEEKISVEFTLSGLSRSRLLKSVTTPVKKYFQ